MTTKDIGPGTEIVVAIYSGLLWKR